MVAGPEDRGPFYKTPSSGNIFERLRQIIIDLGGTPPEVEQSGPFHTGPRAADMLAAIEEIEVQAAEGGGGGPPAGLKRMIAIYDANGVLLIPDGVTSIRVFGFGSGGGGAGGGAGANVAANYGGGSGGDAGNCGCYFRGTMDVEPGETIAITIGAGGIGGAGGAAHAGAAGDDGAEGTDGGDTIVDGAIDSVTIPGGPGTSRNAALSRGGKGGTGAAAGAAPTQGAGVIAPLIGGHLTVLQQSVGGNPGGVGATNPAGGGGGAGGGPGTNTAFNQSRTAATTSTVAAGQVGGTNSAIVVETPLLSGLVLVPRQGGNGGNGGVNGGPGVDGQDALGPQVGGGGGGGGAGGTTSAGKGGDGGDGGPGWILIEYFVPIATPMQRKTARFLATDTFDVPLDVEAVQVMILGAGMGGAGGGGGANAAPNYRGGSGGGGGANGFLAMAPMPVTPGETLDITIGAGGVGGGGGAAGNGGAGGDGLDSATAGDTIVAGALKTMTVRGIPSVSNNPPGLTRFGKGGTGAAGGVAGAISQVPATQSVSTDLIANQNPGGGSASTVGATNGAGGGGGDGAPGQTPLFCASQQVLPHVDAAGVVGSQAQTFSVEPAFRPGLPTQRAHGGNGGGTAVNGAPGQDGQGAGTGGGGGGGGGGNAAGIAGAGGKGGDGGPGYVEIEYWTAE